MMFAQHITPNFRVRIGKTPAPNKRLGAGRAKVLFEGFVARASVRLGLQGRRPATRPAPSRGTL
jgi:hypothetical protein